MNHHKKQKITRKFYNSYKKIHKGFTNSIKGIDNIENREWYSSVMLNRLMFLYFIQKEGFLNNDINYLRNQLKCCNSISKNYYNYFIKDLFYKALSIPEKQRTDAISEKVGDIPYLNGGIFNYHILEKKYPGIYLDNSIFNDVYKFFEKYNWELDSKTFENNEITPEIVGYIFEKYINRKEKGAYYTEKDTTDYITKYTIIPYILFELEKRVPNELEELLGDLLQNNLENYVYKIIQQGKDIELPDSIRRGYEDISCRTLWNDYTDEGYGLNTEIWRETIQRRKYYNKLKEKMHKGISIDDLLTYNLNIEQLIYDIIKNANAELIKELYFIISGDKYNKKPLSILDPTCGSGAFLFSALNILEKIYEECINKIKELSKPQDEVKEFRNIIKEVDKHNNTKYYIYKSIIVNNLYGVDIMSEATEITRLRMLLKLFSLVDSSNTIEPLPDINFNILSGNTLVGFVNVDDISNIGKGKYQKVINELDHKQKFEKGTKDYLNYKTNLNELLDKLLYKKYNKDNMEFKKWKQLYNPFHWLIEFDDIMENGGFDCIIGNPPYIEYYQIRNSLYSVKDYVTKKCGNISAFITERSYDILSNHGHLGFIAPISIVSTPRMSRLRNVINNNSVYAYYSNFGDRPGTLFNGVHQKLNIILTKKRIEDCVMSPQVFTTNYYHWYSSKDFDERKTLFEKINYIKNNFLHNKDDCLLKIGKEIDESIWFRLQKHKTSLYEILNNSNNNFREENRIYLSMRMTFWTKCFLSEKQSNEFKEFALNSEENSKIIMAVFNSNLFFYFWEVVSDCWHITNKELKLFKFDIDKLNEHDKKELYDLAIELEEDLEKKKGYVGTVQTDYEYYHRKSKHIIDRIDKVLANTYNFTDEELDYIINYNIKYKMSNNL